MPRSGERGVLVSVYETGRGKTAAPCFVTPKRKENHAVTHVPAMGQIVRSLADNGAAIRRRLLPTKHRPPRAEGRPCATGRPGGEADGSGME